MFFSQCLLSNKGPLGPVLVAAYFHKKLKKDLVTHTDISFSVDKILTEGVPVITYRVLGYLLLGVVRIYSKKVDYVLSECHRVQINFKKSTLGKKTDAHGGPLTERFDSIILPERFELDAFDFEVAEDFVEGNVMPPQEIMLHDSSKSMEMWTFSLDEYCEGDPMPLEICVPKEVPLCVLPPEFMDIDEDRLLPGQNNSETRVENLLDYTSFPGTSICFEMRDDTEEQSPNLPRSIGEEHNVDTENLQLMEIYSSANGERHAATGAPEISAIVDVDPASNPPDVSNSLLIIMSDGTEERPQIHPGSSSKEHDIDTGKSRLLEMNSPNKEQRLNNQEEIEQSVSIDASLGSNPPQISDNIHFEMSNEAEEQLAGLCRAAGKSQNTDAEKSQILAMDSQDNGKKHTATRCPTLSVTIDAVPVSNFPDVSGAATPDFMTLQTPANKERGRHLGKRKILVDSHIVLPNKVLRKSIHDSSGLIRPRMRAPHTALNAWRAYIIPNLSFCFLDPLVPCNSEELRSLFSSYNEWKSVGSVSKKDAPEKLSFSGSSSPNKSSDQKAAAPETPVQQSVNKAPDKKDKEISDSPKSAPIILSPEEPAFAPETPAQRPSMALFDMPEVTSSAGALLSKAIRNTGKELLLSEDVPDSDLHMIGISKDIKFSGEDHHAQNGWSARTRTMARFLKKSFSEKTKHQEEEGVNMSQVLQGQTREISSRVFYEVLVLKTKSVVEVQQESAYSDILIWESSRWLECCEELGL